MEGVAPSQIEGSMGSIELLSGLCNYKQRSVGSAYLAICFYHFPVVFLAFGVRSNSFFHRSRLFEGDMDLYEILSNHRTSQDVEKDCCQTLFLDPKEFGLVFRIWEYIH